MDSDYHHSRPWGKEERPIDSGAGGDRDILYISTSARLKHFLRSLTFERDLGAPSFRPVLVHTILISIYSGQMSESWL